MRRVNWEERVGLVFGRLITSAYAGPLGHNVLFKCVCTCGKEVTVRWSSLKSQAVLSCGCLSREIKSARSITHGLSRTKIYDIWKAVRNRCHNRKNRRYADYGGRGITVCETWRKDFVAFYNWAMANGYAEGLQIDRRDNDGPYSPDNCRFVTNVVNNHNTKLLRSSNTSGYRGVSFTGHSYRVQVNSAFGPPRLQGRFQVR